MAKKFKCEVCGNKYKKENKATKCCEQISESYLPTYTFIIPKHVERNNTRIHKTENYNTPQEITDLIEIDLRKMNKDQLLDLYNDYNQLYQIFNTKEYKDVLDGIESEFNNRILNENYVEPQNTFNPFRFWF